LSSRLAWGSLGIDKSQAHPADLPIRRERLGFPARLGLKTNDEKQISEEAEKLLEKYRRRYGEL